MAESSNTRRTRNPHKQTRKRAASPIQEEPEEENPQIIFSNDVSRFPIIEKYKLFDARCRDKTVLIERMFDEDFLKSIDFPYLDRLKEWGWWDYIQLNCQIMPNIVRVFYFLGDNTKYERGVRMEGVTLVNSFVTFVLDKYFYVNANVISEFLTNPNCSTGEIDRPEDFDFDEACRLIYNDNSLTAFKKNTVDMPIHHKILQLMVCQVFNPRAGGFAFASHDDIFWMYKIIKNERLNLCEKISRRMVEYVCFSKNDNKYGLPYAKLVLNIVAKRCGKIINQEQIDNSKVKSAVALESMGKIGWVYNTVTRSWVNKNRTSPLPVEDVQVQPQGNALGLNALMNEVRAMNEATTSRLERIEERMSRMEERDRVRDQQLLHLHEDLAKALHSQNLGECSTPFPSYNPPSAS